MQQATICYTIKLNMIQKAIIPVAGLGTRFLPLSKAVSKELLPLADRPVIQYLLEEALAGGIKEIIFIVSPGKKREVLEYFKKSPKLEKILKERKKEAFLLELKRLEEVSKSFSFSLSSSGVAKRGSLAGVSFEDLNCSGDSLNIVKNKLK